MAAMPETYPSTSLRYDIAAWVITACLLLLALKLHLLPALLAGLLVYELVHVIAPHLKLRRGGTGKLAAVALIAAVVVAVFTAVLLAALAFLRSDAGSLPALLQKMAEIVDTSRGALPAWVVESLPADADALRIAIVNWLRQHALEVQTFGKQAGYGVVHILVGMVIGAMISLRDALTPETHGPLANSLEERAMRLGDAFGRIVFAQIRIAALNATFTAIYLIIVLPLLGVHLPLTKTMIAITFIAGLLPVIGNLISNTMIVIVSLSASIYVALGSLAFLIVIHKLEYFLNARIVGAHIKAHAWELLLAMLIMEAAFGIPGLIAATIYYAYLKDELAARGAV
jgi:predicted PurR-regulated permease PerM